MGLKSVTRHFPLADDAIERLRILLPGSIWEPDARPTLV